MKTAIITLIALAVFPAFGGWTNFPAWQHPGQFENQMSQLWSQQWERVDAATTYLRAPSYPSAWASWKFWLTSRDKLVELKAVQKGVIQYYVVPWKVNETDLTASNGLTFFTVEAACIAAGRPVNYYDYTPYSFLSGLGGQTSDVAAVGHPHGWTNEYTMQGGSALPLGRTNWYTTDYGIDGLKEIGTNLYLTTPWNDTVASERYSGEIGYGSNYSDSVASTRASWTNSSSVNSARAYWWILRDKSPLNYDALAEHSSAFTIAYWMSTNIGKQVSWWLCATNAVGGYYPITDNQYHENGDGWTPNTYQLLETPVNAGYASAVTSVNDTAYGNASHIPQPPADPANTNETYIIGYSIRFVRNLSVADWSVTNGFKWFR